MNPTGLSSGSLGFSLLTNSRHDLYSPLPFGLQLKNLVDGLRLNGDHQRRRADHVRDWLAFGSEEPNDPTGQAGVGFADGEGTLCVRYEGTSVHCDQR
jgi:hypothetical protein